MRLRVAHPYLHTRVSLMARRLMGDEPPPELFEAPLDDLRPLFSRLGCGALLSDDPVLARRSLEQRRLSLLLEDVVTLSRALSGHARDFLLYWTHFFELINVKIILHGRLTGQAPQYVRSQLLDMGPFATLPVDALLRAENEIEALRALENTPFAEFVPQARRVLERERDLFHLDTAFDRRFYTGLLQRAGRVRPRDPDALRALMSALMDATNLSWLLRYRFVYGLPPAETYFLLMPADYELNGLVLRQLTTLGSLGAVLASLPGRLRQRVEGARTPEEVGGRMEQRLREVAGRVIRRSPSAFVRAFAYLLLRERELRLLRGIVKAHQLDLDMATMRAALDGPAEAADV